MNSVSGPGIPSAKALWTCRVVRGLPVITHRQFFLLVFGSPHFKAQLPTRWTTLLMVGGPALSLSVPPRTYAPFISALKSPKLPCRTVLVTLKVRVPTLLNNFRRREEPRNTECITLVRTFPVACATFAQHSRR